MTEERELREANDTISEFTEVNIALRDALKQSNEEMFALRKENRKLKRDILKASQTAIRTANFEIIIDRDRTRGSFEHHIFGEDQGGELLFENNFGGLDELIDFDGMYDLPQEIIDALEVDGFFIPHSFK